MVSEHPTPTEMTADRRGDAARRPCRHHAEGIADERQRMIARLRTMARDICAERPEEQRMLWAAIGSAAAFLKLSTDLEKSLVPF